MAVSTLVVSVTAAVLLSAPALAAVPLTVSTTADIAANAGDCGNTSTTPPSPLSLREATCIANNYGNTQAVIINVPAGHYTLTSGELQMGKVAGSDITLTGAGSASTIIDGNHASRVLDLDPSVVGGVTTSISGVTITNGRDGTFGGAGMIAGGGHNAQDNLTVSNSVFSNNQANFAVPTASNKPGGGLSFQGGSLTVTNVTFTGNQSFSSAGGGLWYETFEAGGTLTMTGSTFSGNSTANSGASGTSGGALALAAGAGGATYNVSNSTFTGNTSSSSGNETAAGGAIFQVTGNLTLTGSTFTNNSVSNAVSAIGGGPIIYTAGSTTMHYNRFLGNTGTNGVMTNSGSGTANVTENWWGCNTGPNTTGCETDGGSNITDSPRLVLTATASPAHVVHPSTTSTITASLLTDSAGGAVSGSNLTGAFDGLPVSFADPPGDATVGGSAGAHSVNLSSGTASIGYQAGTVLGPDNVLATLDNGTSTAILEVDEPPTISSANVAHFQTGTAGSFTITTTGYPPAAITETGSLPSGLTFHDNGDGSATISGTPGAGTGGNYTLNLTAANGYLPNATQTLTVNVAQPPAFTSGATATFVIGSAGSFGVTTSGFPTVATITESGTLPAGITFTDNGNGTATIAGTPTGTGNTYPVTLTASNGVSPNATQNLTIQVNQPPQITSADHATFQLNAAAAFTVTTTGTPTASLSETGSLPPGMTFTDNGDGTATLGGTPTSGGSFTFTITAGNGVSPNATQSFTATVNGPPSITSADHTTFQVGSAGSFTVTTTAGFPTATTLTETGSLPSGVTFTDNGDGTATLAGTAAAGTGGSYPLTITAGNGVLPNSTQAFTLTVTELPKVTSADHTTFHVGSAGSFTVTTTAGFPTATTLTETGALPSGVTFTDNGDGTATLAGTPASGTGGSYPLTLRASNTAGHTDQAFTLTVTASALITSADHTTFAVGSAGAFTVTTTPTATTITESGSLPSGVTFTDNGDGTATLAGTAAAGTGGSYPLTITASNGIPPDAVQSFTLTVTEVPGITSADHTTFHVGSAGTFTVTTHVGFPTATTMTETGALPSGVTFTDNGDGTATLAGTPAAGTGGSYPLTLRATNTAGHTDQAFTLTVTASPLITSADHTTFAVGSAGTFTVTTSPTATTITETGALPSGVSFSDNGDGTATLAGTPAAGAGGSYALTISAGNGVPPDATQAFTLTVTEVPAITSANHAAFVVGSAGTFTVTTHAGFPTATAMTETGALPSGVTFTDNGDGTGTLAGTAAAGTGGSYPLTLTATNSVGHTDQAFTLTVSESPAITSADHATFTVGSAGTFTVTTSGGFPSPPALSETGSLPSGVTLHDNGNGTATLAGTPTIGGIFPVTISANNGVAPATTQGFTLTVNGPPAFTSADVATFLTGNNCGSYLITTTAAGSPGATHLTESGKLPGGLTFHDNGDGTATISGCANGITGTSKYQVTLTATNPVGQTSQPFTVYVKPPATIPLPRNLPASDGALGGIPSHTTRSQVLHLTGSGYAPGAAITIGYYAGPVTIKTIHASSTGTFATDITLTATGNHTYVAAGIGGNGNNRFLEAATTTG